MRQEIDGLLNESMPVMSEEEQQTLGQDDAEKEKYAAMQQQLNMQFT
jgi:hypothetical protein